MKQVMTMPIFFRSTPVRQPLAFDSIGNNWPQDPIRRPKGYPLFHYLQTESGQGEIRIQGKSYILNPGEGVLISPFLGHFYESKGPDWRTCFAAFTGTVEDSISKMTGGRPFIFTDRSQGKRIAGLIRSAVLQYENPPTDEKALSICCYNLLLEFVEGGYTHDLEREELYKRYVEPVMKEIENNYSLELTVEDLSRLVYITPQYLARLFERFLGCSTYEYLTSFRINKAKGLLITDPHLKIQDIARLTGFSSVSHFITMFKRTAGVTPLQFRKLN